jgi:hypothetical protein
MEAARAHHCLWSRPVAATAVVMAMVAATTRGAVTVVIAAMATTMIMATAMAIRISSTLEK